MPPECDPPPYDTACSNRSHPWVQLIGCVAPYWSACSTVGTNKPTFTPRGLTTARLSRAAAVERWPLLHGLFAFKQLRTFALLKRSLPAAMMTRPTLTTAYRPSRRLAVMECWLTNPTDSNALRGRSMSGVHTTWRAEWRLADLASIQTSQRDRRRL